MQALDGFIMVFSSNGHIYYVSEGVTSLLGYLPSELENTTIYDITYQEDQPRLYNILLNPGNTDKRDRRATKKGTHSMIARNLNVLTISLRDIISFVY